MKCRDCKHLLLDPKEDTYHSRRFCALTARKIATYGHLLPKTAPKWCPLRVEEGAQAHG